MADPFENMSDEDLKQYSMDDILRAVIAAQVINKSMEGEKEDE